MFELPEAKRVRRTELRSSSSRSASPDSRGGNAGESAAQAALATLFSSRFGDLETEQKQQDPTQAAKTESRIKPKPKRRSSASSSPDAEEGTTAEQAEEQPPSYSFRLFATPLSATKTTGAETSTTTEDAKDQHVNSSQVNGNSVADQQEAHQIVLEPLNGDDTGLQVTDVGSIVHKRPRSYYLATPWSASHRQAASQSVIITAEELAREAGRRWPGCAVPWRVKTVRVGRKGLAKLAAWSSSTSSSQAVRPTADSSKEHDVVEARLVNADGTLARDERTSRRAKPGKKTRLQIRKKIQAEIDKKQQAKLLEEQRAADKTRKNREKKVRRKLKMKEKEKQDAPSTADGGAPDGGDGETTVV